MSGQVKQALVMFSVFPPNFELFLLINQSVVDLARKRVIECQHHHLNVAIVVIDFHLGPP